jgi:hypothetical protein
VSHAVADLWRLNGELLRIARAQHTVAQPTVAMDATLIEAQKREVLYCYKHFNSHQPLNTRWAEQGVIVHSDLRNGNPAGGERAIGRSRSDGVTNLSSALGHGRLFSRIF